MGDLYKVSQLEKMLKEECDPNVRHYGARLSHWTQATNILTIDA